METRVAADPSAFFDAFYPQVRRYVAAASGAPEADVEDLVQETLLAAWRGRARFRGESALLTWILGIAKNQVRMRGRTEERRDVRERAKRALAAIETELVPQELLETAELVRRVRRALLDLDEGHADALVRRYFDGLSVRALAAETGESEKAVESRLHRAREALRDRLRSGEDDERE